LSDNVLIWPDKKLREAAEIITQFGDEVNALAKRLSDAMFESGGIGLAAPQIGVHKQMFIVEGSIFPVDFIPNHAVIGNIVFTNPVITWESEETNIELEGCLYFPEVFVPVVRPNKIKVSHTGIMGLTSEIEAEGLLARCILHENDHLNGRLLVDNVGALKKSMIKRKMLRRKKK